MGMAGCHQCQGSACGVAVRGARLMGPATDGHFMLNADVVRELQDGGWERNDEVTVFDLYLVPVGKIKC